MAWVHRQTKLAREMVSSQQRVENPQVVQIRGLKLLFGFALRGIVPLGGDALVSRNCFGLENSRIGRKP